MTKFGVLWRQHMMLKVTQLVSCGAKNKLLFFIKLVLVTMLYVNHHFNVSILIKISEKLKNFSTKFWVVPMMRSFLGHYSLFPPIKY